MTAGPSPEFGALLKRHRLTAGLSQEQLAERAGVSARGISDLERGARRAPYPHTVRQLASALGLGARDRDQLLAAVPPRRGLAPPTPAQERTLTNLPLALTSFVGRAGELAEVRRLLWTTRLLTLTGPGGCGKTRLALELARRVGADEPGEVWLVDLAALADAALVPPTVAAVLGVRERPGQSLTDTLLAACTDRRLLLVLDNCEHLLTGCAPLAEALVQRCPAVRVLATSREPLAIDGEVVWPVPPLALPDLRALPPLDELARCEAVHLLLDRAVAAAPAFRLDDANAVGVARLCRRLDGLPLAMELAAARLRSLPLRELLARLDDRFRLLTGGSRTALPRHRTLRAVIDWSHDLLTEPERRVLRRLSVCAGGATIAAAEAVCAAADLAGPEVLPLLLRLVDRSLVIVDATGAEPRYRLLETVRQYGQERLVEAGEAAAARERQAAWCLALAEQAEPELFGAEQVAWFARLDAEQDNLRAALAWCLTAGEPGRPPGGATIETGLRLAGALVDYWFVRGPWTEAATWYERLLAGSQDLRTAARATVLRAAGQLLVAQLDDIERGTTLRTESAALCRAIGDRRGLADALSGMGSHERSYRDYARGSALLAEALALARATGDRRLTAWVLHRAAGSADLRQPEERAWARAAIEESLALFEATGQVRRFGVRRALGRIALSDGDLERAWAAFSEDLVVTRAIADTGGLKMVLLDLATVALARGEPGAAAPLFRESLRLSLAEAPRPHTWLTAVEGLARVALDTGQPARAARLLGAAEALWRLERLARHPHRWPIFDATVAGARAALDEASFAAAWVEGERLTADEATAYALANVLT